MVHLHSVLNDRLNTAPFYIQSTVVNSFNSVFKLTAIMLKNWKTLNIKRKFTCTWGWNEWVIWHTIYLLFMKVFEERYWEPVIVTLLIRYFLYMTMDILNTWFQHMFLNIWYSNVLHNFTMYYSPSGHRKRISQDQI